ncbi:MAG TPA: YciI family protein [Actinomycetota bacterium]|nr:YciI family protein [Actinomycetota bacterium]
MQYLLLIYAPEFDSSQVSPEDMALEMKSWTAYTDWLKGKGWYVAGEALQPVTTATTIRERDGKTLTTDGPFAETKEQLGGYYLVDCANLDEAIEAGSRIPSVSRGSVEVRPIMSFDEGPS